MFEFKQINDEPDAIAPDGSEVRLLCNTSGGSMAHFRLAPGGVSKPIRHRTIDEVWYITAGEGRMWLSFDDADDVADLRPGISVSLPLGTRFQFRCDGATPLEAVGVATPPWPGTDEAIPVEGPWEPTV